MRHGANLVVEVCELLPCCIGDGKEVLDEHQAR